MEALEDSDAIYEGNSGELLAAKKIHADKYLVVVYKEISEKDGFVITAFLSSRRKQL
ncbi:MAG: hypothetical protein BWY13_00271 [Euryarchaeota archaeon ADurb.Bin190]|nr:MAG: hypothetical protein BWY13_00271 [Euryarchaeota archaeon ADurb.Bin190]